MSADGKYMVLEDDQSPVSPQTSDFNPPISSDTAVRPGLGDGDERKVEGAECESEA